MSALDSSIVNTILPVLREAFKSDVATVEWWSRFTCWF
jgi:hypothetical protein